jgi:filamentous hemagglutinin family protein
VAFAQVTLDGTLGPAGSLPGPNYQIPAEVGRQVGGNLFHSFGKFSVYNGESATFTGPDSVKNIIGRVTGGERSWLDGTLRSTIPNADLYLLNPAGILFGPNASLDVNGSFHASTANYLRLGEKGRFDATEPRNSLLTSAPPSAFGFLGDNPALITVRGSSLEVPVGKSLSLIGGDIELTKELATSSNLFALSGRINIASVASSGEVIPNNPDEPAGLKMEGFEKLGNIRLTRSVFPDDPERWVPNIVTDGNPGGTIVIRGGQLTIDQGAIGSNSSSESTIDHPGIGIDIDITENIFLLGEIGSVSYGSGRAGDVRIVANRLHVRGGQIPTQSGGSFLYLGNIGSRAFGAGDGGNIDITTDSLLVENNAQIGATAEATGSGSGGNLTIQTGDLQILGDQKMAFIHTSTFSTGNAGNLTITADKVLMRGGLGFTGLSTGVDSSARGSASAGDLRLSARNLQVLDGAQITAGISSGAGDGGKIEISADTIVVDGVNADGFPAGIFASSRFIKSTQESTTGDAGDIRITAQTLKLTDRVQINVFSDSYGDPGDIDIQVKSLEVSNGAYITNSNFGLGKTGGIINIEAEQVRLEGPSPKDEFTGIFSLGGVIAPSAGNIFLNTINLHIVDGALISSRTFGPGAGGAVTINADHVLIAGEDPINQVSSQIDASTRISGNFADNATGRGGDIVLQARELDLRDGGQITTASRSAGDGGNITLVTERLTLADDASISVQSMQSADAGSITITARDHLKSQGSTISANANQGAGGNIAIQAPQLVTLIGSNITTSVASGDQNAGNVTITKPAALTLVEGSRIQANAIGGNGGNLNVAADTILADAPLESILTATSERGINGRVEINSPDVDISAGLVPLPSTFFDATTIMTKPCAERSGADVISLTTRKYEVLPYSPYALQVHLPRVTSALSINGQASATQNSRTSNWLLPSVGECKRIGS